MEVPKSTGIPVPAEQAFELLRGWADAALEVGVVYCPSHGEAVVVSKGTVHIESQLLRIKGRSHLLQLSLRDSNFQHGPISVFSGGYVPAESPPGLHVTTSHSDWLFLAPRFNPVPAHQPLASTSE